jgi:TRAP-type C4-dicarboxylate transport system permease large subunit
MIGLITPPYGLLLFVMSALTSTPLSSIMRAILPFVFTLGGVLVLLTLFPSISLFLPRAFGYS